MSIFEFEGKDAAITDFVNAQAAPMFRQWTHFYMMYTEDDEWLSLYDRMVLAVSSQYMPMMEQKWALEKLSLPKRNQDI